MESGDVRITSYDVACALGLQNNGRRKGNWVNYCCPFCDDRKYRFGVNLEKGGYKCFHCGAKGTPLELYARIVKGRSTELMDSETISDLIREMTVACGGRVMAVRKNRQREQWLKSEQHQEIPAAQSGVLDNTYRMLLSLPQLKLTSRHRANLRKRGLTDAEIDRNGYGSFSSEVVEAIAVKSKEASRVFNALKKELYQYNRLRKCSSASLVAGIALADSLLKRGCTLSGVPGFFRVKGKWILNLPLGMLIPTRNSGGQIVGLQVRRDTGESPRYLTVSANRLPEGVTVNIARTHFPLGNAELEKDTRVYLTEGPLKADVALSLLHDEKAVFIAVQGVSNTKLLDEQIFPALHTRGIRSVINALDMDKLTNPGVMAACANLRKMAEKHGIEMKMFCWDVEYAREKARELEKLCREHRLPVPLDGNVFKRVGAMALTLHRAGVKHSIKTLADGKTEKHYWNESEKGIDDHLLNLKRK